jgi:class 3 adenylate cyclase
MDYTVIGDTVNLAKRLQENAPGGTVLMSERVYEIVQHDLEAIFYKEVQVKGREQSVKTYALIAN